MNKTHCPWPPAYLREYHAGPQIQLTRRQKLSLLKLRIRRVLHWWRWTLTPHFAWQYYDNPETPWFFCCRFNWLRLRLFDYTWMRDKTCESPLVIFTLFGVGLVRKRPETWLWRLGEQGE